MGEVFKQFDLKVETLEDWLMQRIGNALVVAVGTDFGDSRNTTAYGIYDRVRGEYYLFHESTGGDKDGKTGINN